MEYVSLVARWLHILAGMTAVGGSIFARFVVLPTLEPLPPAERTELQTVDGVREAVRLTLDQLAVQELDEHRQDEERDCDFDVIHAASSG